MVDNENQWEDMEYSEGAGGMQGYSDDDVSNEEYSDQEYESYDDEYEEDSESAPKKGNPLGCLLLLLLLLAVIGGAVFMFLNKKGDGIGFQQAPSAGVEQSSDVQMNNNDTTAVGDAFFNEAGGENADMMAVDFNASGETTVTSNEGGEEIVATVMEMPAENTNSETAQNNEQQNTDVEDLFPSDLQADPSQGSNEIMVAYNKKTRPNPFKPPIFSKQSDDYALVGDTEFEIIEPPSSSVPDENLTRLLQTQISGILYDDVSPSAIVNLNGIDQFVKIGDVVSGYRIESITKDKVQITYKNNTYVASVGELFTRGYLEKQQAVVGLENKFAGRYRNNN